MGQAGDEGREVVGDVGPEGPTPTIRARPTVPRPSPSTAPTSTCSATATASTARPATARALDHGTAASGSVRVRATSPTTTTAATIQGGTPTAPPTVNPTSSTPAATAATTRASRSSTGSTAVGAGLPSRHRDGARPGATGGSRPHGGERRRAEVDEEGARPRRSCSSAMRLVRFETGSHDEDSAASRAGWRARPRASSPARAAARIATGVSRTTAASRLTSATVAAPSTHSPSAVDRAGRRRATASKQPISSSSTARGTASSTNRRGSTRSPTPTGRARRRPPRRPRPPRQQGGHDGQSAVPQVGHRRRHAAPARSARATIHTAAVWRPDQGFPAPPRDVHCRRHFPWHLQIETEGSDVALTERNRNALYQGLTRTIGDEEAVEAMLSQFPARECDELATETFVRGSDASSQDGRRLRDHPQGDGRAGFADLQGVRPRTRCGSGSSGATGPCSCCSPPW